MVRKMASSTNLEFMIATALLRLTAWIERDKSAAEVLNPLMKNLGDRYEPIRNR
jgi:hypothetical protein